MTVRSRVVIAVLWSLSLVIVAQWSASGQVARPIPNATPNQGTPGVEVRFLKSGVKGGLQSGTFVGNIDGQWLPVVVDTETTLPNPDRQLRPRN